MVLSVTEENYIKGIYHLQAKKGVANTNDLAAMLNTKAASVSDMLAKLKAKKMLTYEKYHGFKLNETGNKIALIVLRRHRLWEYFLVTKLGIGWDKVHAIAEELEHVSSNELIKKLDKYLGTPKIDPHGDPIPDTNGELPVIKQINLYELAVKAQGIVSSVSNQSSQMLEMLNHYGIAIGTKISVNRIFNFDNSLEIKVSRQPLCIISEQVAKNIFVFHD